MPSHRFDQGLDIADAVLQGDGATVRGQNAACDPGGVGRALGMGMDGDQIGRFHGIVRERRPRRDFEPAAHPIEHEAGAIDGVDHIGSNIQQ